MACGKTAVPERSPNTVTGTLHGYSSLPEYSELQNCVLCYPYKSQPSDLLGKTKNQTVHCYLLLHLQLLFILVCVCVCVCVPARRKVVLGDFS